MTRTLGALAATAIGLVLLVGSAMQFGAASAAFAFVVVWVPMTWLGTVRHRVRPRLPERFHRLRAFEQPPRLLVATLGVVGHAVARGWWLAAGLTLLFNVLMNGYPVMLQRYNRALLHQRYGPPT